MLSSGYCKDAGILQTGSKGAAVCRLTCQGEPQPPFGILRLSPLAGWDSKERALCISASVQPLKSCVLSQPGVTTDEIDRAVHKMTIEAGAYPSPLRYGACCKTLPSALIMRLRGPNICIILAY